MRPRKNQLQQQTRAVMMSQRTPRSVGTRAPFALTLIMTAPLLFLAPAHTANAATLVNLDQQSHVVEVFARHRTKKNAYASAAQSRHELGHRASLKEFCERGCKLRLNGSTKDEYILDGSEQVSIEGGLVYYDGEVRKPAAAETGRPTSKPNSAK